MIVTIWIALALFVAGEVGSVSSSQRRQSMAALLFLSGAVLCVVHMLIAMQVFHAWDHRAAVAATAIQTAQIYGVNWGGGVYVNYVFAGVWTADALQRVISPASFARRSRALVWTLRAFYFLIIVNGAVIFATPGRRWMGVGVIGALLLVWFTGDGGHEESEARDASKEI